MSNVTHITRVDPIRAARAQFVKDAIDADGRSQRYVAAQIGLNPSSFSERLRGKVAFLADELEGIAITLKEDPVEFYAKYIAASDLNSPEGD